MSEFDPSPNCELYCVLTESVKGLNEISTGALPWVTWDGKPLSVWLM